MKKNKDGHKIFISRKMDKLAYNFDMQIMEAIATGSK